VTNGLDHFRNRDYSSTLGRWVTLDPMRAHTVRGCAHVQPGKRHVYEFIAMVRFEIKFGK